MENGMSATSVEELESAVKAELGISFSEISIVSVDITPDFDYEGDDILRVKVVYDGKPKDIKGNAIARAIRSVRPLLNARDWPAFPSISFVTREDAGIATRA